MIEARFDLKDAFFDRKAVTEAVEAGTRKAMVQSLGAYRERLINQFQFGNQPSKPGQSPTVHSRSRYANLRNVLFSYDAKTKTGVAGSIRLPRSKEPLPGLLEHGGPIFIPRKTRRDGSATRARTIKIAKRPAASVALLKSVRNGEIITPFRNSVGGR